MKTQKLTAYQIAAIEQALRNDNSGMLSEQEKTELIEVFVQARKVSVSIPKLLSEIIER